MKSQPAQPRDDGMCRSCVSDVCVTGSECVTLGIDNQPSDTEMLDWLISNDANVNDSLKRGCWNVYGTGTKTSLKHVTAREAIKAAMRADRESK